MRWMDNQYSFLCICKSECSKIRTMEPINREKIESKHLEGQLGPCKYQKSFFFFVLARSQVNLLKYLTVEYYFPTNTLSIK